MHNNFELLYVFLILMGVPICLVIASIIKLIVSCVKEKFDTKSDKIIILISCGCLLFLLIFMGILVIQRVNNPLPLPQ